jgi:hypothetical protein
MTQTLCARCKEKPCIAKSRCRDCKNEEARLYSKTLEGKKKKRERRLRAAGRNREFVDDYLRNHPCVDCGEDDLLVLEFDHVNEKVRGVRELMAAGRQRIEEEIDRCVVRCANCHTRRHRLKED